MSVWFVEIQKRIRIGAQCCTTQDTETFQVRLRLTRWSSFAEGLLPVGSKCRRYIKDLTQTISLLINKIPTTDDLSNKPLHALTSPGIETVDFQI